jgi:hydroxysqualene synthase
MNQPVEHYENFPVASWLCPPALRQPIAAIYHFARTADDIADEGSATAAQRLADLAHWRALLQSTWQNDGVPPQASTSAPSTWLAVLTHLNRARQTFNLPLEPFLALLNAFEQDVNYTATQKRYTDSAELMAYCAQSANPVGRLLLHLYGIQDEAALRQSDCICSALQLINFWQDLSVDLPRGRHYLPLDSLVENSEADVLSDASLKKLIDWTRELIQQGAPLCRRMPGRGGWELRLVVQGGLRVLEKVEALGPRVMQQRPRLRAGDWLLMLWRAIWM